LQFSLHLNNLGEFLFKSRFGMAGALPACKFFFPLAKPRFSGLLRSTSCRLFVLMSLASLKDWAPFKIDALGLVTILGQAELDLTLGSLVRNRLTEFLPVLAAFVVAGDNITKAIPGFTVYNITDGIVATDVAGWFARWLLLQDFKWNSSSVRVICNFKHQSLVYMSR